MKREIVFMLRYISIIVVHLSLIPTTFLFSSEPPSGTPEIREIEPLQLEVGRPIRIKGKNFGPKPAKVTLIPLKRENGQYQPVDVREHLSMQITKWTENEIQVVVPHAKRPEGKIKVCVSGVNQCESMPVPIKLLATDKPFSVDFYTALDFTLERRGENKNFSKAFPHIGLRVNEKFQGLMTVPVIRGFINFRLTSTTSQKVEVAPTPSTIEATAEKSFEISGGIMYAPVIISIYKPSSVVEMNMILKFGGQTSETGQDFFLRTFYGGRILQTGTLFNGGYIDIGVGQSKNFIDKNKHLFKFEGFIPFYSTDSGLEFFLNSTVETDFGNKPDLVTFTIGTFFEPDQIFNIFFKGQTP